MARRVLALAAAVIVLGPAALARAELDQSIDLSLSGLVPQTQKDPRWGGFPIGPSDRVLSATANPADRINFARCGCMLTSLSTAVTSMAAGSGPWYPHLQIIGGSFQQTTSLSPRYLDDYFNIGPNRNAPRAPGWGFVDGSGGSTCGVGVRAWAATHLAEGFPMPGGGGATFPTGVTWDVQGWGAGPRALVDSALLEGRPSMVYLVHATGAHANLIVGWDNTKKKYLVFDPMWNPAGGVHVAGHDFWSGATEEERYSDYLAAIGSVLVLRPVLEPSFWMSVVAFFDPSTDRRHRNGQRAAAQPPIRLRLTDPRGRRTGYDPSTGQTLQEDTSAAYSELTSFADPLGTLSEANLPPAITAREPEAGTYGLEVFGTADGSFTLKLATVNGDQEAVASTITDTVTGNQTKRYEIVRSEAGAVAIGAVAAFAPRARAGNDASGYAGTPLVFDGRGSHQADGTIAQYSWAFGDGATANGAQQAHAYVAPGTYTAALTVTNASGVSATDTRTMTVVPAPVHPKETIRVNVTGAGAEANDVTWFGPDISPDGRYVTFWSRASNLVVGDTNGADDVFVKDLVTGTVERVSVAPAGGQSDGGSTFPSTSADGRFVAFQSSATNLGGGANPALYVRDRQLGTTTFISRADYGTVPSISDDGRYIAFSTTYPVPPDADGAYVYDRQEGTFEHIQDGGQAPQISGDGNFVAFQGYDPDAPVVYGGVMVYDRQADTTEVASQSTAGTRLAGTANPTISADGRYVGFDRYASSVGSPPPPYDKPDVYLRDRQAATTEQINTGAMDAGAAESPAVSPDGRFVAFMYGPNVGLSAIFHAYVRDRQAGTLEQVSVADDGAPATFGVNRQASPPNPAPDFAVTASGAVAFWSSSTNLVADDANAQPDVFLRRPLPPSGAPATPLANLGGPYVGWASALAVPASIRLDASASLDPADRPLTAHWDFGDGSAPIDGALVISHAYSRPGIYEATLTVAAGADTSAPVRTEVQVLPALPPAALSASSCAAPGATLAIDGAATAANAPLIAHGWDASTGPLTPAPVTITLPWGQTQAPTTLPELTFATTAAVPANVADGSYTVSAAGASASFDVPCASAANRPPLANAGGPAYTASAAVPIALDGTRSSDPEGAALTYRWDFGDGTSGTGATPAHVYEFAGEFMVTLVVNDGTNDSMTGIGTRSFALVVVGPPPAAVPTPTLPDSPPVSAEPPLASDARCANGRLRLTDVYPDGRRVRIRGVAPAAARGQTVAITFAATRKRVATAVVAADLSFTTTVPLPPAKLRKSNRARYSAAVAGQVSTALKLARRMYLQAVTRTGSRVRISGQVVAPLARRARDRRIILRITTTCAQATAAAGGRAITVVPSAGGRFTSTLTLTKAELSAKALYVRGQTTVRRSARKPGVVATFSLIRGL